MVLSIPLGVLAAIRPNTSIDRAALTLAVFGQAMPSFFFALILIYVFGFLFKKWGLGGLPITGSSSWRNFVMPSIALGYYATPAIMRLTRAGMLEVLAVRLHPHGASQGLTAGCRAVQARAAQRGYSGRLVVPGVQLGFMLGGSIVIETIFSLNGLGALCLAVHSAFRFRGHAGDRVGGGMLLYHTHLLHRPLERLPRSAHPRRLTDGS